MGSLGPSSSPSPRPHPALPLPALVRVYFSGSNSGTRCDGGMLASTLAEGHIITRCWRKKEDEDDGGRWRR